MNETQKMQVVDIRLDQIDANPKQPRQRFDAQALEELAASIRDKGVLQPITVRAVNVGEEARYVLIAGERRTRACRLAERVTIPAIVLEVNQDEGVELALLENIQREDLGPVEEATALSTLLDHCAGDVEQVALRVRKSITHVRKRLNLLSLHEQIQRMLDRGEINLSQAEVILEIPDVEGRLAAAKLAHELQLNANQLKGRTQHLKKKPVDEKETEGGVEQRKRTVTFPQLSGAVIKLFDLVDETDLGQFPVDHRDTLFQQFDALFALFNERKRELGLGDHAASSATAI